MSDTAVVEPPVTGTPATAPAPGPKTTVAKVEPKVHPGLLAKIEAYDEHVEQAQSFYVEIIETIQKENLTKPDVIATMMKARKITFETAASQYSRMKKMWENPEVLKQLKDGDITLRMARDMTKASQSPRAGGAGGTPGASGGSKETKEARYERCRKSLVASVKECGFDRKSAILAFEADLKAAGVA